MNFTFHNPTKVYFGRGKIGFLNDEIKKGTKVLLTYGSLSIKKNGLYDEVRAILDCEIHELSGIEPNPKLSSVRNGIKICRDKNVEFILAVGGGSVIDASKAISIGAKSDTDVWNLIIKKEFPVFSILDPTYTISVPRNQTINGIVDTISHLLEQYFNAEENAELVDRFCESSISYMMEIAPKLLDNLDDYKLREAMMD